MQTGSSCIGSDAPPQRGSRGFARIGTELVLPAPAPPQDPALGDRRTGACRAPVLLQGQTTPATGGEYLLRRSDTPPDRARHERRCGSALPTSLDSFSPRFHSGDGYANAPAKYGLLQD